MSEANQRTGQDPSKFDNMSTAELNEYLRQDAERDDSDLDDVLYIMEVLAKREKEENNDNLPDVRKAWASFQANYNTADNDGRPLHDFDDEAEGKAEADITSIKSASKGITRVEKHGFLIHELLTPDDIQKNIIDKAGAELTSFEHVNYCLAVRKN